MKTLGRLASGRDRGLLSMAPMQKLNGVLSILNWYISSLIPLLLRTRICASKWIKSTDVHSKYAKIQTEQGNKVMWTRFPLYFDLKLSSHSLIHIDRSRPKEQTRALVGLSQSSIGQLRSNTIHMFYRWGCEGGGKRNQASKPPTPPLFPHPVTQCQETKQNPALTENVWL